jgi:hypothetical protein
MSDDDAAAATTTTMPVASGVPKAHVCERCHRAFSRLSSLRRHADAATCDAPLLADADADDAADFDVDVDMVADDEFDADAAAAAAASTKRRRRNASSSSSSVVVTKKSSASSSKKRAKSGGAASLPKVRRAHHVVVAAPSSKRDRVLDERVDGARVHDEYDGRELYLPFDAARLRPLDCCLVCRQNPQVDDQVVAADDVDFVRPPVAMLQCNICTVKVHPRCVPLWHRNDNIDYRRPLRPNHDTFFACMDCVRCLCCGARDAGPTDSARWRLSFRFCEPCCQLQGALNYCSLCCLFYRSDAENMVQCELCDFWIHSECDDISALKYDAMAHRDELYVCRLCRQKPDYNKRLARVIKVKLLVAATADDDAAVVQAALDDVDRELFVPFQPVYVSDDDDAAAGDDAVDDESDVDNGSKRKGARRRKRPNVRAHRSAVIAAAAAAPEQSNDHVDEQRDNNADADVDASFEMPAADAVATGPRLVPPPAREYEAEFARVLGETSSYSEYARRRTYNFVETSLLDAALCCFCGASAPDTRCAGCAEAFHWYCINPTAVRELNVAGVGASLLPIAGGEWRCATCKLCTVCGSGEQDSELVVCDWCDRGTHTFCLDAPIAKSDESWACTSCRGALDAAKATAAGAVESNDVAAAATTATSQSAATNDASSSSEDMPVGSYVGSARVEQQISAGVAVAPGTPGRSSKLPPSEAIDRMVAALMAHAHALTPAVKSAARRLVSQSADGDGEDAFDNSTATAARSDDERENNDLCDVDGDDDDDDDDDRVLAVPMTAEQDVAICVLCRLPVRLDADAKADALQQAFGRALPVHCGARVAWVHAQCGLWAPEAEELFDGRLLHVDTAMQRCPRLKCAHCLRPGASVGCTHGNCQRCYHLPCALLARGALDPSDRTLRCPTHRRDRAELLELLEDSSPRVTQVLVRLGMQNLLSVDAEHTLVTTVNKSSGIESDLLYESVDAEADAVVAADGLARCKLAERMLKGAAKLVQPCHSTFLRYGELVVAACGSLTAALPPSLLPAHSPSYLFPTGYVAFRHFWSVRADCLALYCFRILPASGAAEPVVVDASLAGWAARCAPVRFCVDEMSDSAVQVLARSASVLNHEELARRLASKSADALFGSVTTVHVDAADDATAAAALGSEPGRGCRFVGSSLERVWACVTARTAAFRQHGTHALSAADMFGLAALPVVYQLERLPAAERCLYYQFRTRFAPLRLQLPSEPFRPPKPVVVAAVAADVDPIEAEMAAAIEGSSARSAGLALVLANRRRKGQQHARGLRQAAEERGPSAGVTVNDDDDDEAAARKRRQLELLSGGVPIAVQYRRMKERADRVSVGRSKIEGWGGFLNEAVAANEMLIEYVGELIRLKLADLRELEYDRKGMGCYMFRVNDEWVVDATMTGGPARFLNHSCDPNCVTRIEQVEGAVPRILIYSKRRIEAGTELTYDYKFPIEDKKIPCFCGAAMCRGSMN